MAGTRIVCAGGEIIEKEEAGSPQGTTITVDDIFYNTPVRKKFQKSLKAELGYITAIMERIVLSSPFVSFRFIQNGREKFATSPGGDLLSVIAALFGNEYTRSLIRIEGEGELVGLKGYISRPSLSRHSGASSIRTPVPQPAYSSSLLSLPGAFQGSRSLIQRPRSATPK